MNKAKLDLFFYSNKTTIKTKRQKLGLEKTAKQGQLKSAAQQQQQQTNTSHQHPINININIRHKNIEPHRRRDKRKGRKQAARNDRKHDKQSNDAIHITIASDDHNNKRADLSDQIVIDNHRSDLIGVWCEPLGPTTDARLEIVLIRFEQSSIVVVGDKCARTRRESENCGRSKRRRRRRGR